LKLIIVHSHFRPGGVRRIIELATPHLARTLRPRVDEVVLAAGEAPEAAWLKGFQTRLGRVPATCAIEPALGYLSEQRAHPRTVARRIHAHFQRLLADATPGNCIAWAHNLGLGRNLLLARELVRVCQGRSLPLVAHHHDWWFENRWVRWSEMRRAGFRSTAEVAGTIFSASPNVRHVAINQADARLLQRHFPQQAAWLPNLTEPGRPPSAARVRFARAWLRRQLGADAPVWLLPCRVLRRKNVAEALLLVRWLRPEAWLVTTAGVSSADEQDYADQLAKAAQRQRWPLRLGVLRGDDAGQPSVAECFAASEAVLLTSIQEGFGLPYLEAAAAQRPLLARVLPNIAPDLGRFGLHFPQSYDDVLVTTDLFNWNAECRRQARLHRAWRAALPRACQRLAEESVLLAASTPPPAVPFSRLTLAAQLEVLSQPPEISWRQCAPLNPCLRFWRERAASGRLRVTPWPRTADRWLSGRAYAKRFAEIVAAFPLPSPPHPSTGRRKEARIDSGVRSAERGVENESRLKSAASARNRAEAAQGDFIRERLQSPYLYPLLWNSEP